MAVTWKRRHDYAGNLRGTLCACGGQKGHGWSFCRACRDRLPQKIRRALDRRVGDGYEDAYDEAYRWLLCHDWVWEAMQPPKKEENRQ